MNILVVSQYYYPEPFRIEEICEELVRRGHHVCALTAQPNYPDGEIYEGYPHKENPETINGVTVYRCKVRPRKIGHLNLFLNYVDFWIKASIQIRKLKDAFDCVYAYQLSPISSVHPAIMYGQIHKKPVLLYCLDIWPESMVNEIPENSLVYKLIKKYSSYIYRRASKLAVSSPSFGYYLSSLTGINVGEIEYIPQHSQNIGKQTVGDVSGGQDGLINYVFLGNVGESQNVHLLIKAASQIKNEVRFHIHIVGSGSYLNEVKTITNDLQMQDYVTFYGRQPKSEMVRYYQIADVCYLSLRDEGSVSYTIPGKLQEYMSAGKAILAAIKGDAAEVIKNANCGLVVDNNEVDMLADAMKKMTNDSRLIKEYGNNARKYYLKNFTLEQHVNRLEALLMSLK